MLTAAAWSATAQIVAAHTPGAAGSGGNGGTIAVAVIGAVSVVIGAATPELIKMLRRGAGSGPVPPAVATPAALEALKTELLLQIDTRVSPVADSVRRAEREIRAIRGAVERREQAHRDEHEKLRDGLQRHLWRDHAPRAGDGDGIPAPRSPEPA